MLRLFVRKYYSAHNLLMYQKKLSYMKIHNMLLEEIRSLTGKKLKTVLTDWLVGHSF